ncbi:MAG: hypothetical protein WCG85_12985 [Polyangia bacterium]
MRGLVVVLSLVFITLTAACSRTGLLVAPDGGGEGGSTGVLVTGGATGITIDTTNSAGGTSSTGGIFLMAGSFSEGGTGGGGTGGSSIPLTGNCANLTCLNPLNDLLSTCQVGASEACTVQVTMSPEFFDVNDCYASGVKMQVSQGSMGPGMSSMTLTTVKRGSSVCYSIEVDGPYGYGILTTVVVKDGAGTPVATLSENSTASVSTVTCPGGTPTVVDATCGNNSGNLGSTIPTGSNCTPGLCAF